MIDLAGCCQSEFDRTYPSQLNGIISPNEYGESIDRINQKFITNKQIIYISLVWLLIVTVLTSILIAIDEISTARNHQNLAVAAVVVGFMLLLSAVVWMVVLRIRRVVLLRKAVTEESEKYSSRSPTPCSWRLQKLSVRIILLFLFKLQFLSLDYHRYWSLNESFYFISK